MAKPLINNQKEKDKPRPHKKNDGGCPYCESTSSEYSDNVKIKSNGYNQKHLSCGKYSFYNEYNKLRYPLQNPNDSESTPYI